MDPALSARAQSIVRKRAGHASLSSARPICHEAGDEPLHDRLAPPLAHVPRPNRMLTALDIIVLFLIGGGAVLGVIRGFVTEVLSLFAWVAAILALKLLHTPVANLLAGMIGTQSGGAVLAFLLIFAITFFGGKMVAASLGRRTRQSVLGGFDRALGGGFGALKGLLIATILFLAVNLGYDTVFGSTAERPRWLRTSRTYPLLNASGRAVVDWVQHRRAVAAAAGNGQAAVGRPK
jgi:membrane protein required for colicin V production